MSEATATDAGNPQRIVKGAYTVVIGLAQASPTAAAAKTRRSHLLASQDDVACNSRPGREGS